MNSVNRALAGLLQYVSESPESQTVKDIILKHLKALTDELSPGNKEIIETKKKHSSLSDELLALRYRLKVAKVGTFDKLLDITYAKIARISDRFYKLVEEGEMGNEEFNVYQVRLEEIFNGRNEEFNIKGVRNNFDNFILMVSDELELGDII